MTNRRKVSVGTLKGLKQYKDWTVEELEQEVARLSGDTTYRVEEVLASFYEDYDLSDMNANDEHSLLILAQIFVRLEDLNKQMDQAMADLDEGKLGKLNSVATILRKDASQIQIDLHITRKARKGEKEQGLVQYIEDIKGRAAKLLDDRLSYIYCPKCQMLLCNVWHLYPDANNIMKLTCVRIKDVDEGSICGHEFTVTSKELKEGGNRNITGVLRT